MKKNDEVFLYFISGPVIEIRNSSEGFVYSAGSHITLECLYRYGKYCTVNKHTVQEPFCNVPYHHTEKAGFQLAVSYKVLLVYSSLHLFFSAQNLSLDLH